MYKDMLGVYLIKCAGKDYIVDTNNSHDKVTDMNGNAVSNNERLLVIDKLSYLDFDNGCQ